MIRVDPAPEPAKVLRPRDDDIPIPPGIGRRGTARHDANAEQGIANPLVGVRLPRRKYDLGSRIGGADVPIAVEHATKPRADLPGRQLEDPVVDSAKRVAQQTVVDVGGIAVTQGPRQFPLREKVLEMFLIEVQARAVAKLALENDVYALVQGWFRIDELDLSIPHLPPGTIGRDEPAKVGDVLIDQARNALEDRGRPTGP